MSVSVKTVTALVTMLLVGEVRAGGSGDKLTVAEQICITVRSGKWSGLGQVFIFNKRLFNCESSSSTNYEINLSICLFVPLLKFFFEKFSFHDLPWPPMILWRSSSTIYNVMFLSVCLSQKLKFIFKGSSAIHNTFIIEILENMSYCWIYWNHFFWELSKCLFL